MKYLARLLSLTPLLTYCFPAMPAGDLLMDMARCFQPEVVVGVHHWAQEGPILCIMLTHGAHFFKATAGV